jgi:phage protein U
MAEVMLKLGEFKFEINTATYQSLKQSWEFNWQSQARIGKNPAKQFTGYSRSIEMAGVMYPGQFGSRKHIDAMVAMAGRGRPLLMVASTGVPLGYWCITKIDSSGSVFFGNGEPRRIDFSLSLEYYGEKYVGSAA